MTGSLRFMTPSAVVAPFERTFGAAGAFAPASTGVLTKMSVPYGRLEGTT